jgi:hypothetical protein
MLSFSISRQNRVTRVFTLLCMMMVARVYYALLRRGLNNKITGVSSRLIEPQLSTNLTKKSSDAQVNG